MIRPIVKDIIFLGQKSTPATKNDLAVAQDLLDTLIANADKCVGMAANMIGFAKRIIAFRNEVGYTVMFNPEIIHSSNVYEAEEACLSLTGTRKTQRFQSIKVRYQSSDYQIRQQTFTGLTAQIIQHEIDHLNGIII